MIGYLLYFNVNFERFMTPMFSLYSPGGTSFIKRSVYNLQSESIGDRNERPERLLQFAQKEVLGYTYRMQYWQTEQWMDSGCRQNGKQIKK